MIHRCVVTALAIMCLAAHVEAKPAIKVQFQLISQTLNATIKNKSAMTNHDCLKDVSDQLVAEFQQQAAHYFPFIDWRTDNQNVVKTLSVMIWEEPLHQGRSDYRIRYWTGGRAIVNSWTGGREIAIGSTDAFVPWNDPQQPNDNPPELVRRAKQQIDADMTRASVKDLLNFFLKDVEIIKIPPPQTKGIRVAGPCMLDLPLAWDALLADRDGSVLKAAFSSKALTDGWIELGELHQCELNCQQPRCVRAATRNSNLPGPICSLWTSDDMKAVSQFFSSDGLQSLNITVKQFARLEEDSNE